MEITGNQLKQRIADFHAIPGEQITMNALFWRVLADGHAALVWYNTNGDKFDLPYAAVAIDSKVFINERDHAVNETADIGKLVWMDIDKHTPISGADIDRQIQELQPEQEQQEETRSRGMHR